MLPKYIKVKNFTSYLDETIDFTKFGDIFAIIGENGAGKSSIIDIMTTAIFYRARGVDAKGSGMENLISKGTDGFEIEFVFSMNSTEYKIIRRKFKAGGHELEFYINGQDQSEKLTETQQKILNVIKMNYDTFMDTICVGQGQSGRFMNKKPNERKDVFVQVLGLDKYEILENYTKELKKQTKTNMEKIEEKLNQLEIANSLKDQYENDRNDGKKRIVTLKDTILVKEHELEQIVAEKAKYEQLKQQVNHILTQRVNLERKITNTKQTLQSAIDRREVLIESIKGKDNHKITIDKTKMEIENDQEEYTKLSNEQSSLNATNNMLKNQAKDIKNKYNDIVNYDKGICEFCGHDITNEYKQSYSEKLKAEGISLLKQTKANDSTLETLNNNLSTIKERLVSKKSKLQTVQNLYNEMLRSENEIETLINRIIELKNNLAELNNEFEKNKQIKVTNLEEKTFNDNVLRIEINQLRQSLQSYQSKVAIAENQLKQIQENEKEMIDLNNKFSNLKMLHNDYDDLIIAWGKSGIQAGIIRNALPEIETEINYLLQLLCNGDVSVSFNTEKESKNKKVAKKPTSIETLDIIINDRGESRTYETYSGGEQFRVDFACHVGLAKFLAKRAGATIDFFIVDEGLGSQDENARQQFVTSVYKLTKTFKQVMIITHIEEMKNAFNNKVIVYKDPLEGSKVDLML